MDRELSCLIGIVSHKGFAVPAIPYHEPLFVGKMAEEAKRAGFRTDSEGDNIADKNDVYNELTAQYWMWKNLEHADYIGLCHYRRYFSFSPSANGRARIGQAWITSGTYRRLGWEKETIAGTLGQYDAVIARPEPGARPGVATIAQNHALFDDRGTLALWSQAIAESCPEYVPYIQRYTAQRQKHMFNMFIMKAGLFREYSQWLFTVLASHEKKMREACGENVSRVCGLAGEHLLNVFILSDRQKEDRREGIADGHDLRDIGKKRPEKDADRKGEAGLHLAVPLWEHQAGADQIQVCENLQEISGGLTGC